MDLIETREIPNAGRGVVARETLAPGTVVLNSGPPAAHVIFRIYRKEACAQCFLYDNGRSLPVRDNVVEKSFCSASCQEAWFGEQGDLGLQAWRSLATFVRARVKNSNEATPDGHQEKPDPEQVNITWNQAESEVAWLLKTGQGKKPSKKSKTLSQFSTRATRPDLLAYFLSALQTYNRSPEQWNQDVLSLVRDETPYKTLDDLEDHCAAFVQLAAILPRALIENLPSKFCCSVSNADSHNAFGINSGGEDLEEHMGYAVYPSASYFNHSCTPNLVKIRHGRSWTFATARKVSSGEECCITYLGGDEKSMSVDARRARLKETWGFVCGCARCVAETTAQS